MQLQEAVESYSLERVQRTASPVFGASFERKLTAAAARRVALPPRCILGNTGSTNVAEADCALAVREAQRRPSLGQLKLWLHVLGHTWSALHHARHVRVLQQRRPPPALRQLAEALLPMLQ
jgi:hypothetical protein